MASDVQNQPSALRNAVLNFQRFTMEIRNPAPYKFLSTELKGALNIIIGLSILAPCPYFKCTKKLNQYKFHLDLGKKGVAKGVDDLKYVIWFSVAFSACALTDRIKRSI